MFFAAGNFSRQERIATRRWRWRVLLAYLGAMFCPMLLQILAKVRRVPLIAAEDWSTTKLRSWRGELRYCNGLTSHGGSQEDSLSHAIRMLEDNPELVMTDCAQVLQFRFLCEAHVNMSMYLVQIILALLEVFTFVTMASRLSSQLMFQATQRIIGRVTNE